jgi:hypothetical protein
MSLLLESPSPSPTIILMKGRVVHGRARPSGVLERWGHGIHGITGNGGRASAVEGSTRMGRVNERTVDIIQALL